MKAPFPYFGGKSTIAPMVWQAFGQVDNYIEPFAGSLAVFLAAPYKPKWVVLNDLDGYLINFWRALQNEPERLADMVDPVISEADIVARYNYLSANSLSNNLMADHEYYDIQAASFWIGIASSCIGRLELGNGKPITAKLPMNGKGIFRTSLRSDDNLKIMEYFYQLSSRLRNSIIACGEWDRVVGSYSITTCKGVTGVFLDPPYITRVGKRMSVYANDSATVGDGVAEWAIKNGDNPEFRIALCGHDGDYAMPDNWRAVDWSARKRCGYGVKSDSYSRENDSRERLWLSPYCIL